MIGHLCFSSGSKHTRSHPRKSWCSLETWQNRKINLTFLSLDKVNKNHLHVNENLKMSTKKCRRHTTNNPSLNDTQDEITIHELWGNWEKDRADTDIAFILNFVLLHKIYLLFLLWELFYVLQNWQRDLSSIPLLLPLWSSAGRLILIFFKMEIMFESPCMDEVILYHGCAGSQQGRLLGNIYYFDDLWFCFIPIRKHSDIQVMKLFFYITMSLPYVQI